MASEKPTIYFGYGSNLWLHQMHIRCPQSQYMGIARLNGYEWIINDRGYANVVEVAKNATTTSAKPPTRSQDDEEEEKVENEEEGEEEEKGKASKYDNVVYGLVYSLTKQDESRLDKNEGVPVAYTKEHLPCDFWSTGAPSAPESPRHRKIDTEIEEPEELDMLVYIDRKRVAPDEPRDEYVYRMNRGIEDALAVGVPEEYVQRVMRRFIDELVMGVREGRGEEVERLAREQAEWFRDESGVF